MEPTLVRRIASTGQWFTTRQGQPLVVRLGLRRARLRLHRFLRRRTRDPQRPRVDGRVAAAPLPGNGRLRQRTGSHRREGAAGIHRSSRRCGEQRGAASRSRTSTSSTSTPRCPTFPRALRAVPVGRAATRRAPARGSPRSRVRPSNCSARRPASDCANAQRMTANSCSTTSHDRTTDGGARCSGAATGRRFVPTATATRSPVSRRRVRLSRRRRSCCSPCRPGRRMRDTASGSSTPRSCRRPPSVLTLKYWASPFQEQVYGVELSSRCSRFTLDGGKYQLPSILMRSSTGASAMTVSPSTAFIRFLQGCASIPSGERDRTRSYSRSTRTAAAEFSARACSMRSRPSDAMSSWPLTHADSTWLVALRSPA